MLGVVALVGKVFADNEPIPEPDCDASKTVNIRYAATTKRLYLEAATSGERGGCVTLGQIFEARAGKAPLYAVDAISGERVTEATGTWLLTEELYVEDGITLNVSDDLSRELDKLSLCTNGFLEGTPDCYTLY